MKALALAALLTLAVGACGDGDSDSENVTADDADFPTLDASGDSYLDADEVAEWVDNSGTFDRWDADSDSELDRDEIAGNAFNLWDTNDDKKLSQKEWESGTDLWYPDNVQHVSYGDWDGDGDSEVDADEFSEKFDFSQLGEAWHVDSFNEETFKKAYFELYDFDDDGRVSEDEWTRGTSAFGIAT